MSCHSAARVAPVGIQLACPYRFGDVGWKGWGTRLKIRYNLALMGVLDYHPDFLESLPVAVYTCIAPTGTLVFWNRRAVEFWGREPRRGDVQERFCGSYKLYLPTGEFMPHDQCPMATALKTGESFRNQLVIMEHPDGSRKKVIVNISPLRDADGKVVGAINVLQEVTTDDERRLESLLNRPSERGPIRAV